MATNTNLTPSSGKRASLLRQPGHYTTMPPRNAYTGPASSSIPQPAASSSIRKSPTKPETRLPSLASIGRPAPPSSRLPTTRSASSSTKPTSVSPQKTLRRKNSFTDQRSLFVQGERVAHSQQSQVQSSGQDERIMENSLDKQSLRSPASMMEEPSSPLIPAVTSLQSQFVPQPSASTSLPAPRSYVSHRFAVPRQAQTSPFTGEPQTTTQEPASLHHLITSSSYAPPPLAPSLSSVSDTVRTLASPFSRDATPTSSTTATTTSFSPALAATAKFPAQLLPGSSPSKPLTGNISRTTAPRMENVLGKRPAQAQTHAPTSHPDSSIPRQASQLKQPSSGQASFLPRSSVPKPTRVTSIVMQPKGNTTLGTEPQAPVQSSLAPPQPFVSSVPVKPTGAAGLRSKFSLSRTSAPKGVNISSPIQKAGQSTSQSRSGQTIPAGPNASLSTPVTTVNDKRVSGPGDRRTLTGSIRGITSSIGSSSRDPSPVKERRFGFFSRKSKTTTPKPASTLPPLSSLPTSARAPTVLTKPARKGPSAGTGHEGYGKYGFKTRASASTLSSQSQQSQGNSYSTSTATTDLSSTSIRKRESVGSRKSSFTSASNDDMDNFYKSRLEPVILTRDGVRANRNSESLNEGAGVGPSFQGHGSSASFSSTSQSNQHLSVEHAEHESGTGTDSSSTIRPIHSSAQSQTHSQGRQRSPSATSSILSPASANITSPPFRSYNSAATSRRVSQTHGGKDISTAINTSEGKEGSWLRSASNMKSSSSSKKSSISRLFGRARRESLQQGISSAVIQAPVIQSAPAPQRNDQIFGAHFDILDDEDLDTTHKRRSRVEQSLREIESEMEIFDERGHVRTDSVTHPVATNGESSAERSDIVQTTFSTQSSEQPVRSSEESISSEGQYSQEGPRREPRLKQIGRIPRVVSQRNLQYSRPSEESMQASSSDSQGQESSPLRNQLATVPPQTLGVPSVDTKGTPWASASTKYQPVPTNVMLHNLDDEREFLAFTPRNESYDSGMSSIVPESSSGTIRPLHVNAAPARPLRLQTAFPSRFGQSLRSGSSLAPTSSALSEDDTWAEYDEFLDHVSSPVIGSQSPAVGGSTTSFTQYPKGSSSSLSKMTPASQLQLQPALATGSRRALQEPKFKFRAEILQPPEIRDSMASGSRYSSQTIMSSGHSSSDSNNNRSSDTSSVRQTKRITRILSEKTEGVTDPLRFNALMTARWLSFDQVLFSPAHNELSNPAVQSRVLVLDGLGNDDFSTYSALNYTSATVYNLTSTLRAASGMNPILNSFVPPPNHRTTPYASLAHPMPFPKGFFDVVVLRFPQALPPHHYNIVMSESRRVLKPGGYLEMALLDIDLVMMGTLTRKAIRDTKLSISEANADIYLGPLSEMMTRLARKKGLEDLTRCVMAVPLTGSIKELPQKVGNHPLDASASVSRPLQELLDQAPVRSAYPERDMVAHVGRWWWSRCFEEAVSLPMQNATGRLRMFDNEAVLHECDERATGLRLVLAYARKPAGKREIKSA